MLYIFETTGKLPSEQGDMNRFDRMFLVNALEARNARMEKR